MHSSFQDINEDIMNLVEAWITYVWLLLVPGNTVNEKRIFANNL